MEENKPLDEVTETSQYIPEHTQPPVWIVLVVQICLAFGGALAASLLVWVLAGMLGWNIDNLMEGRLAADAPAAERGQMRVFLGVSHLFTFTLSAWLTGWFCFRRLTGRGPGIADYFRLQPFTGALPLVQGILLLMAAMPFVLFSFEINQLLPLPDYLRNMEGSTNELMKNLLKMDHPTEFLINMLIVAVLPAIGEELVFRGVLQRQLQRLFDPLLAILLASMIFSAIHLQFEGFLPRMLLGMVLGWAYWRTNSLWVPIAAHFFNNGLQVALQYFSKGASSIDIEKDIQVPLPMVLVSVVLTWLVIRWMSSGKNMFA